MVDILTKRQKDFLKVVSQSHFLRENFYLTGGTALAGFYLQHRQSEDLDFFSEKAIDLLVLDVFVKSIQKGLGINKIDFQQSFNRNVFFLDFGDEILKTEFTFFPFPRIERGNLQDGVAIDSILDIAVNKLFTIYQQVRARDYIDLYFICKKYDFTIKELTAKAKIKFDWHIDPIQLGTQFIKAQEAKDLPKMTMKVNKKDWQDFFIAEAEKLKSQVVEGN